jgi:hypothetical protein
MTNGNVLPESFLRWNGYRYLKWSVALTVLAAVAYGVASSGARGGDTFAGYVLGGVAGGLMLWLVWFGIRKRRFGAWRHPLVEWLSAHVYLGLAVPVLAAFHCDFALHGNVHGLAYALMFLTVVSGVAGTVLYREIPAAMTRDHPDERLRDLLAQLHALDAECEAVALGGNLPDAFFQKVMAALACARTPAPAGTRPRDALPKAAHVEACSRAVSAIREAAIEEANEPREATKRLLQGLQRKVALLKRLRQEVWHRSLLEVWLVAHVPLAVAAIAALFVHVFVVLFL